MIYRGIPRYMYKGVNGEFKGIQGNAGVYKGIKGCSRVYKGIQGHKGV